VSFKHTKKKGGFDAIKKRVKTGGVVDVGIIDAGQHDDSPLTVATIGYRHEFGIGVPERSFFRTTLADEKTKLIQIQNKMLVKILDGEQTTKNALGQLGEYLSGKIQKKIVDIKSPANSEATKAKKGSSNPLIDTGQLKNSIKYKVHGS